MNTDFLTAENAKKTQSSQRTSLPNWCEQTHLYQTDIDASLVGRITLNFKHINRKITKENI